MPCFLEARSGFLSKGQRVDEHRADSEEEVRMNQFNLGSDTTGTLGTPGTDF